MKLQRIMFYPVADVEFTWIEVESFFLFAEAHYDYKCKELAMPGGVLHGMRNMFNLPIRLGTDSDYAVRRGAKITYRLDFTTADLLAKCVEKDPSMLYKMNQVLRKLNAAWRKANRRNLP